MQPPAICTCMVGPCKTLQVTVKHNCGVRVQHIHLSNPVQLNPRQPRKQSHSWPRTTTAGTHMPVSACTQQKALHEPVMHTHTRCEYETEQVCTLVSGTANMLSPSPCTPRCWVAVVGTALTHHHIAPCYWQQNADTHATCCWQQNADTPATYACGQPKIPSPAGCRQKKNV